MTQKEKLEQSTGEKFPEPTEQEYKKIQIEKTPFWIVGKPTNWNVIFGKWKLNQEPINLELELTDINDTPLNDFEIKSLALDWLHENIFNNITSMIIAITTDLLNNKNQN